MDADPVSGLPVWRRRGGACTAEEIAQQPALREALAEALETAHTRIDAFLGEALRQPGQRVLFTGAGSSGFHIAESL